MTKNKKLYVAFGIAGVVILAGCIILISVLSGGEQGQLSAESRQPSDTIVVTPEINPEPIEPIAAANGKNPGGALGTSVYTMENGTSVFVQTNVPLPEYDPEGNKPEGTPPGFTTQTFTDVPETTSPPYTTKATTVTPPTPQGTDSNGLPVDPYPGQIANDKNGVPHQYEPLTGDWIPYSGRTGPGITLDESKFSDDWDVIVGY